LIFARSLHAALLLVACSARADWAPIGGTEHSYEYVDMATLLVAGDLRRVWILDDLAQADKDGDMSYRTLLEYNCTTVKYRSLQSIFYAGSMATGAVTARSDKPSGWRPVQAGSISASVMRAACSRR